MPIQGMYPIYCHDSENYKHLRRSDIRYTPTGVDLTYLAPVAMACIILQHGCYNVSLVTTLAWYCSMLQFGFSSGCM